VVLYLDKLFVFTIGRQLFLLTLLFVLVGCEAPLVLDEVEKSHQTFARRTDTFLAVDANAENIVVVGSHGLVLNSNDDGKSWQRQELAEWPALIDVAACSNGSLAILSFEGDVWVSENKGESWEARKLDTEESPQAIACDSSNRLWVVGAFATILHSKDMAQSWEVFTADEDIILNSIQFINDNEIFVSGEFGTLMKSNDAGATWKTLASIKEEFYPQDLYFEDSQNGWVIGLVGAIFHTKDGGRSWYKQESNTLVSLFRMQKAGGYLFAVGGEGKIIALVNNEWQEIDHGKNIRLYIGSIESLNNNRIIVTGPVGTLHILSIDDMIRNVDENAVVSVEKTNTEGS
jgi:photosystem II stability/assembly factor-like uncharacterized protein